MVNCESQEENCQAINSQAEQAVDDLIAQAEQAVDDLITTESVEQHMNITCNHQGGLVSEPQPLVLEEELPIENIARGEVVIIASLSILVLILLILLSVCGYSRQRNAKQKDKHDGGVEVQVYRIEEDAVVQPKMSDQSSQYSEPLNPIASQHRRAVSELNVDHWLLDLGPPVAGNEAPTLPDNRRIGDRADQELLSDMNPLQDQQDRILAPNASTVTLMHPQDLHEALRLRALDFIQGLPYNNPLNLYLNTLPPNH